MNYNDPQYLEAVYTALFDLLRATVFDNDKKFITARRVLQAPDAVDALNQPALIQVQGPLHGQQQGKLFGPGKWMFTALAVLYLQADGASADEQDPLPVQQANAVVWPLVLQVAGTEYERQTLGGLVYHCWVEGEVSVEVIEQQLIIAVPIFILAGPAA